VPIVPLSVKVPPVSMAAGVLVDNQAADFCELVIHNGREHIDADPALGNQAWASISDELAKDSRLN
jgi:hypothetical protein